MLVVNGPVVYLSNKNCTDDRQTDILTYRQIDGNGRSIFSYPRGDDPSRKYESSQSSSGLDYNT